MKTETKALLILIFMLAVIFASAVALDYPSATKGVAVLALMGLWWLAQFLFFGACIAGACYALGSILGAGMKSAAPR